MSASTGKIEKITILGSGTSSGVPVIGCECATCKSKEPKNRRGRCSIMLTTQTGEHLVVDTTPDFREQLLREQVKNLHHVFYTHVHADHSHGFDDLRSLYYFHKEPIHCYLAKDHLQELTARFSYAFGDTTYQGVKPKIILKEIHFPKMQIMGLEFDLLSLEHGGSQTTAFRCGRFAYATDFKAFSPEQISHWRGKIDIMIASGVRFSPPPHFSHSCVNETIELFKELGVKRGIITHLSHEVDYVRDQDRLPKHVEYAYDGMVIINRPT